MSNSECVRIGEGQGRIVRVDANGVEYVDAGGTTRVIPLRPETRMVGLRGAMSDPPWFEFSGPHALRMEFDSAAALFQQLLLPLGRAGYVTLDGN